MPENQQTYVLPNAALPRSSVRTDTLSRHFHSEFTHEFHALQEKDATHRIFLAIENTAHKTGHTPEAVAKGLVEAGLRGGKRCFPDAFVEQLEARGRSPGWQMTAATAGERELLVFWAQAPKIKPPLLRRKQDTGLRI